MAFFLAGVSLLPLFLLISFHETGWWVVPPRSPGQIFSGGSASNGQLQITILLWCAWSGWLALKPRTAALSTVFAALLLLLALAVLGDFGLRQWIRWGRFDRLSLHLWPLAIFYGGLGATAERSGRPWLARPAYVGAVVVFVGVLDLLALNGRTFHYLGLSMQSLQSAAVSNKVLIDTLAALALNGIVFYLVGSGLDRSRPDATKLAAWLLLTISPFSMLEPLGYLS